MSSPATRSAAIEPQLNRSTAIRFSSGQVWIARCDSARMSTRVTAPLGKITWLVSSTVPPPARTAAVADAVSSVISDTGEPGVSAASTVQSCFGTGAVAAGEGAKGRRVGCRPGASFPGMMGEDTRWPAAGRGQPSPDLPGHLTAPTRTLRMDVDAVTAEVAAAVGLAEGPAGVADVLRLIARHEPVAAREISRRAELPVPIIAAICNELRKRGVVDRSRPVRLTP